MAEELGWSATEQNTQLERARRFIDTEMGQIASQNVHSNAPNSVSRLADQAYQMQCSRLDFFFFFQTSNVFSTANVQPYTLLFFSKVMNSERKLSVERHQKKMGNKKRKKDIYTVKYVSS